MLNTIETIFRRLTEPDPAVQDLKQRHQAQLLAAIMLIMTPIGLVATVLPDLFLGNNIWWRNPEFLLMLGILGIVLIIYALSLTRYYGLVANIIVAMAVISVLIAAIPQTSAFDLQALFFLIVPVLLSSVFLSMKRTMVVTVLSVAGVLLFLLFADATGQQIISNALKFVAITSIIILLAAQSRDLLETDRQRELVESETRYRSLLEATFEGIVIHEDGIILEVNPSIERLFDSPRSEIIDRSVFDFITVESHAVVKQNMGTGAPFEVTALRQDGTQRFLEIVSKPQLYQGKSVQVIATRDITPQKLAQQHVNHSLQEKEVLLKEIHHRVKNNLQIISSLLNLQSGQVQDDVALDLLRDSQNRVRSMALIHEKLYQSPNLARIDFADYIRHLSRYLFQSYDAYAAGIGLEIEAEEAFLNIDTAVPCGLILNELVSNALKHGFGNGRSGQITIQLKADTHGRYRLIVADNGIGFPPHLDYRQASTLGLQLVNTLVGQLMGTFIVNHDTGTAITIAFDNKVSEK